MYVQNDDHVLSKCFITEKLSADYIAHYLGKIQNKPVQSAGTNNTELLFSMVSSEGRLCSENDDDSHKCIFDVLFYAVRLRCS
jgi:hypothetical protein